MEQPLTLLFIISATISIIWIINEDILLGNMSAYAILSSTTLNIRLYFQRLLLCYCFTQNHLNLLFISLTSAFLFYKLFQLLYVTPCRSTYCQYFQAIKTCVITTLLLCYMASSTSKHCYHPPFCSMCFHGLS